MAGRNLRKAKAEFRRGFSVSRRYSVCSENGAGREGEIDAIGEGPAGEVERSRIRVEDLDKFHGLCFSALDRSGFSLMTSPTSSGSVTGGRGRFRRRHTRRGTVLINEIDLVRIERFHSKGARSIHQATVVSLVAARVVRRFAHSPIGDDLQVWRDSPSLLPVRPDCTPLMKIFLCVPAELSQTKAT